jgi:alpha-L-fucosidase
MLKSWLGIAALFIATVVLHAQKVLPAYGPLPSQRQLAWEDKEFYLFIHFGPNTFTDLEWGKGTEKEETFNPTQLDCRQWCRIAKAAGARGLIITAKHHDGFCLWPSKYSTHTVAQSKWQNGKGDVLKQLSEACKEYGLEFGVYLSPWDRNHPKYGTPAYNEVFINMLKEVVARYGPLFELWWDGANGEGPNGKKQVYDFKRFEQTVRKIAPRTPIFSDIGPDIRWIGNENGIAGTTNWDLLDTAGFSRGAGAPPVDTLNQGNENGKLWLPGECDVSIRPGWFYHKNEDASVKSPETLFNFYLTSVGRGANLLLNVPPDRRGLITKFDSAGLIGFGRLREQSFRSSLMHRKGTTIRLPGAKELKNLTDNNNRTYVSLKAKKVEVTFAEPTRLNCVLLQEPIQMGQRVKSIRIEVEKEDGSIFQTTATTIGHKRIITFPTQTAHAVRIYITGAKAMPLMSELAIYLIPETLVEHS